MKSIYVVNESRIKNTENEETLSTFPFPSAKNLFSWTRATKMALITESFPI